MGKIAGKARRPESLGDPRSAIRHMLPIPSILASTQAHSCWAVTLLASFVGTLAHRVRTAGRGVICSELAVLALARRGRDWGSESGGRLRNCTRKPETVPLKPRFSNGEVDIGC